MPKYSKQWTGKSSAFKLWNDINGYVDSYTATHQSHLESEWFKRWYELLHTAHFGESNVSFQLAAHLITGNPHATVIDCIQKLMQSIPELSTYLRLHQKSDAGNVRYTLDPYNFTTPHRTRIDTSLVKSEVKQQLATDNPFRALASEFEENESSNSQQSSRQSSRQDSTKHTSSIDHNTTIRIRTVESKQAPSSIDATKAMEEQEDRLFIIHPKLWIDEMYETWKNSTFIDDRNVVQSGETKETKAIAHYFNYLGRKKDSSTTNPFLTSTQMKEAFDELEFSIHTTSADKKTTDKVTTSTYVPYLSNSDPEHLFEPSPTNDPNFTQNIDDNQKDEKSTNITSTEADQILTQESVDDTQQDTQHSDNVAVASVLNPSTTELERKLFALHPKQWGDHQFKEWLNGDFNNNLNVPSYRKSAMDQALLHYNDYKSRYPANTEENTSNFTTQLKHVDDKDDDSVDTFSFTSQNSTHLENINNLNDRELKERIHQSYKEMAKECFQEAKERHQHICIDLFDNMYAKVQEKYGQKCEKTLVQYKEYIKKSAKQELDMFIMLNCKSEMNTQVEEFKQVLREQRILHKTELFEMREEHKTTVQEMLTSKYKDIATHLNQLESDMKNSIERHANVSSTTNATSASTSQQQHRTQQSTFYKQPRVYSPGQHTVDKDMDGQTNINIYDKRQVEFTYNGETYIQDEKEFMKNSPTIVAPQTVDDGLTLYSQLQHNARVYNILMTEIC